MSLEPINRSLTFVAALLTGFFFILISAQVVSRYMFNLSIVSSEELSRYSFFWATMIGTAVNTARNDNYDVRVVDYLIGHRGRACLDVLRLVLQIVFFAVAAWFGIRWAFRFAGGSSPVTEVSLGLVYSMVPLAAAYALIGLITQLAKTVRAGWGGKLR